MLCETFPKFYNDLLIENITKMMQTQKQVITFMTEEQFTKTLPVKCLLAAFDDCINEYHDGIKEILGLMLPSLAHGISEQRGASFGFDLKRMRTRVHF